MADLKQCDRCGEMKLAAIIGSEWKAVSIGTIGASFHPETIELCPSCMVIIRAALKRPTELANVCKPMAARAQ